MAQSPPSHPAAPKGPQYRVLYDFTGQDGNVIAIKKDDLVTILQKDNSGMLYPR
jgi:myosin-1